MNRYFLKFLLIVNTTLFPILVMTGCEKQQKIEQHLPDHLHLSLIEEPPTLDPRKGCDLLSSNVQLMLFEGLMRFTDANTLVPGIAKSIDISDDRCTLTFHLHEALWSDGSIVSASDFSNAWLEILTPHFPSPVASFFYEIENAENYKLGLCPLNAVGIQAISPLTLRIQLRHPENGFIAKLALSPFFPIHPTYIGHALPLFDKCIISNGPFTLSHWQPGESLTLHKNPFYIDSESVSLECIHISLCPHEVTSFLMFESHKIDFLGPPFAAIPNDFVKRLKQQRLLFHDNNLFYAMQCYLNNVIICDGFISFRCAKIDERKLPGEQNVL